MEQPDLIVLRSRSLAGWAPVKDIVFVHRDENGAVDVCFSLRAIKSSASIELLELTYPDHMNLAEGSQIMRLSGSVAIALNAPVIGNQIKRHQGSLFEMHALFKNLTAMSIPYRTADGTGLAYSGFYEYISQRYPLIEDWRDEFGVKFHIREGFGGTNREFTFNLSGVTIEAISGEITDESEFYTQFPELPAYT